MGEAKERAEEIDAIKKQKEEEDRMREEYAKRQREADEELKRLVATPISKEEAEKKFADSKVEAMKLAIVRQKWMAQIDALEEQIHRVRKQVADVDERISMIQLNDAITFRRTLNPAEYKPKMGAPVGPETK